ncbi:hypothetical protein HWV62_23528 [Athelia sp. TMB]|nr:hypothetical protein HWV62_23528 [Athelia sp. TMB]
MDKRETEILFPLYNTEEVSRLSGALFQGSVLALEAADCDSVPQIRHIQASLLYVPHLLHFGADDGDRNKGMRHISAAISTAQWLGLDQLDASRVPMHDNAFRKCSQHMAFELCKRMYHMLSFLDALARKQPGQWKLGEGAGSLRASATELPLNLNDDDLFNEAAQEHPASDFTHATIARIGSLFATHTRKYLKDTVKNEIPYEKIIECDAALKAVLEQLPCPLDPVPGTAVNWMLVSMYCSLNNRFLRLHRPYMARGYVDKKYEQSTSCSIHSAKNIIEGQRIMMQCPQMRPGFIKQWILGAAMVLTVDLVISIDLSHPSEQLSSKRLHITHVLQMFQQNFPEDRTPRVTSQCSKIVEALLAAADERTQTHQRGLHPKGDLKDFFDDVSASLVTETNESNNQLFDLAPDFSVLDLFVDQDHARETENREAAFDFSMFGGWDAVLGSHLNNQKDTNMRSFSEFFLFAFALASAHARDFAPIKLCDPLIPPGASGGCKIEQQCSLSYGGRFLQCSYPKLGSGCSNTSQCDTPKSGALQCVGGQCVEPCDAKAVGCGAEQECRVQGGQPTCIYPKYLSKCSNVSQCDTPKSGALTCHYGICLESCNAKAAGCGIEQQCYRDFRKFDDPTCFYPKLGEKCTTTSQCDTPKSGALECYKGTCINAPKYAYNCKPFVADGGCGIEQECSLIGSTYKCVYPKHDKGCSNTLQCDTALSGALKCVNGKCLDKKEQTLYHCDPQMPGSCGPDATCTVYEGRSSQCDYPNEGHQCSTTEQCGTPVTGSLRCIRGDCVKWGGEFAPCNNNGDCYSFEGLVCYDGDCRKQSDEREGKCVGYGRYCGFGTTGSFKRCCGDYHCKVDHAESVEGTSVSDALVGADEDSAALLELDPEQEKGLGELPGTKAATVSPGREYEVKVLVGVAATVRAREARELRNSRGPAVYPEPVKLKLKERQLRDQRRRA